MQGTDGRTTKALGANAILEKGKIYSQRRRKECAYTNILRRANT
jgi:hypothetical protein